MTRSAVIGSLVLLAFADVAHADKLDDFRNAVSQDGCDSLPYSALKSNCKSQQSYVTDWCGGSRGSGSCDRGVTVKLIGDLVKEHQTLHDLEERRKELANKRSSSADDDEKKKLSDQIDDVDRQIEASKTNVEALEHALEMRKDLVEKTIDVINHCIDYRSAVNNIFRDAFDKVRAEPDAAIKPYADQLRDRYSESIADHEEQIDGRVKAIKACKAEQP